jgi:ribosome maturation factor RimP
MMISTPFIEVDKMFESLKMCAIPILSEEGFELYSLKQKTEFGVSILEILIEKEDAITTDDIEKVHQRILHECDPHVPESLYLEVSSVGVERPLNQKEDYVKATGRYIYIVSHRYKGYANLLQVFDDYIEIEYLIKAKKTKLQIKYEEISQARRAVKL